MSAIENIRAALAAVADCTSISGIEGAMCELYAVTTTDRLTEVLAHIDNQQARIDMLHAEIAQVWQPKHDAQQAEIERLKADAARYQWLRRTTNYVTSSNSERIDVRNCPELWDASIDSLIAAEQKEQP